MVITVALIAQPSGTVTVSVSNVDTAGETASFFDVSSLVCRTCNTPAVIRR